jgi:hypothetical protein
MVSQGVLVDPPIDCSKSIVLSLLMVTHLLVQQAALAT